MPLHLYIDQYFQSNIKTRQHGVMIESLPLEKRPKVERIEDQIIPIDTVNIPIRIYTPDPLKKEEVHYPLLLFFHGGTFIKGGLASHDVSCRLLSSLSGYKVIAVDYSPNDLSTSTFMNCYAATKWIFENTHTFKGKPTDIAIAGTSVGATIATVIALHSIKKQEFHFTKQVLYYPMIDFNEDVEESPFQSRLLYNGKYGIDLTFHFSEHFQAVRDDISPLLLDVSLLQQMPRTLLFTTEYDPLCDEAEHFAKQLKQSGASVKHVHFDGNIHGFMQYFPGSPDYMRGYQLTSEFLNEE